MGNSSGTNALKDRAVIAAIVEEKNKWHETLSGTKYPDMSLINDMLFYTHKMLQRYVQQTPAMVNQASSHRDSNFSLSTDRMSDEIHSTSVEIQTDPDKRTIELKENLIKLQTEKDELTLRLSKVVGEKLMKDNPNITDLSDKNRPTKLGEMYTELYDNEWTDAYEALTQSGYRDREAIETLFETLKGCFEFCQSKADQLVESTVKAAANVLFQEVQEQMKDQKKLRQTLAVVSKDNRSDVDVLKQFFFKTLSLQRRWKSKNSDDTKQSLEVLGTIYQPQSFEEELKRIRKQMSVILIPVVQNAFLKTYWDDKCNPVMKPFIKKCLFLCWMMVVQGPPMCFDWSTKEGSQFDANLYKQYTGSGKVVEFVVWPTLFLHNGGPVIAKGFAQPNVGKTV
ncbi:uncharacterized protein LOC127876660 isoform X5 [Dreissena polymorpha]|uniref:uncharacterized protein LOC127876660 isoform X5 n=1 Tax=Dreissena polymorpha TaxID=45954 RepID=UPI002264BE27|nr:uncharacterized protein LOC127876660 isoform X5 [Dreissena polymorpha]